ncbi:MAG: hypothetical protein ACPLXO_02985 [Desulfurella sp.]|jgi:urate oxidase
MIKSTVLDCFVYDDDTCLVYVDNVNQGLYDLKNFSSLEDFFAFLEKKFDVEKKHVEHIKLNKLEKNKIAV